MRTTVCGSGSGSGQKSLGASSVPMAMTASAPSSSSGRESRTPTAPRHSGSLSSMMPFAFEDRMIPAPSVVSQVEDRGTGVACAGAGEDERAPGVSDRLGGGVDGLRVGGRMRPSDRRWRLPGPWLR
jgi:hypothetical protein